MNSPVVDFSHVEYTQWSKINLGRWTGGYVCLFIYFCTQSLGKWKSEVIVGRTQCNDSGEKCGNRCAEGVEWSRIWRENRKGNTAIYLWMRRAKGGFMRRKRLRVKMEVDPRCWCIANLKQPWKNEWNWTYWWRKLYKWENKGVEVGSEHRFWEFHKDMDPRRVYVTCREWTRWTVVKPQMVRSATACISSIKA